MEIQNSAALCVCIPFSCPHVEIVFFHQSAWSSH